MTNTFSRCVDICIIVPNEGHYVYGHHLMETSNTANELMDMENFLLTMKKDKSIIRHQGTIAETLLKASSQRDINSDC